MPDCMKHTRSKKCKIKVGDSIVQGIPKIDCGPLDLQKIFGKVLKIENDIYQLVQIMVS